MGAIDLHTHTRHSDGTFTPGELVDLAVARGLSVVAVTDHDSTAGLAEAMAAAEGRGLQVVPGVELSAVHEGGGVHLLCYWMDPDHPEFRAELLRLREDRLRRGERMVERLRDLGYPISFERVREIAAGHNVVRPHIAEALVEAGVVGTPEEAFTEELIGDGGRAYVEKDALHPLEALGLAKRAGAVCVLAHPGMWRGERPVPDDLIETMAGRGLDGLEVDHPDHGPEQRARYRAMATRLGLVPTGSSDCHGTRFDPVRLGTVTTDPRAFAELGARRPR